MSDNLDPREMRILTVLGTRPEAIKLAPIVIACKSHPCITHQLCVTGQHREMLDQVLHMFNLSPDHDLDLMRPGLDLVSLMAAVLLGVQTRLRQFKPHWIIVQGDTSTAAAALAAFYEKVNIAHIEAGLRTANLGSPWPEEANRRLIAVIANLHCAPTEWAAQNLRREGVSAEHLEVTGNTVIDALQRVSALRDTAEALERFLGSRSPAILGSGHRILLVTGHRRENLEAGLSQMCLALRQLAARGDVEIVFPVHLNPAVRQIVHALLGHVEHIHLTEPMDYQVFVGMLGCCYYVITDSGGVQEEAPGLGKPVLVTRDTTERPEAIAAGTAMLVGRDAQSLAAAAKRLLDDSNAYAAMAQASNPYGDGKAALRTVRAILKRGAGPSLLP